MLSTVLVPINRAGWPFVAGFAVVTLILFAVAEELGWLGVIATAWCVYFFRDPDRVVPLREGLILSPGDGTVLPTVEAVPPAELEMGSEPRTRISIFLNVFDVHVNRMPCDGQVVRRAYRPGKFVNASFDKASDDNERMSLRIRRTESADPSQDLAVVQIAGLVARRIICQVSEGQHVLAGERYGLIRFGSRVDLFLPPGAQPLVVPGQKVIGGETVFADLRSNEPARRGAVR